MSSTEYRFVTTWRVDARADEVFAILSDPAELPRWWPSVYLSVREVEHGDANQIGRVVSFHTKGWLPYTLRWSARTTGGEAPHTLELDAFGDLEGHGKWTLREEGSVCVVEYVWEVRADKSLIRNLSFAFKPAFEANHRWAMARGEESLKLELLRRRATSPEERGHIPAPPPPTPSSALPMLLGAAGTVAGVVGATALWRRRPR